MMFFAKPRRRWWPWVVAVLFGIFLGAAGYAYYFFAVNDGWTRLMKNPVFQKQVLAPIFESGDGHLSSLAPLMPHLLGLDSPRTVLVLFANNTELRPAGGFLGVYAVLRVSGGHPALLAVDGTEVLDWRTPREWQPVPPAPIKQYLGVDRWYFRDSNWSPDFRASVRDGLALYRGENGPYADDIDMVVAITPTIFEELLRLIGPVTVDGITFTPENAVERLEYEVEYGFSARGDNFENRKQIIDHLVAEVISRVSRDVVRRPNDYLALGTRLVEQKQIVLYSHDEEVQETLEFAGWAGRVATTTGDYVGWVDANLAALKTDHAMDRHIEYRITPGTDGAFEAAVTMTYVHRGTFDWRTTRYLSYARLYVPAGSEFIGVEGVKRNRSAITEKDVATGSELGKTWFGTYMSIEPGETKTLTFRYRLPRDVADMVRDGSYQLLVQKQIGTEPYGLTLELDFGKTIRAAEPAEVREEWGNNVYRLQTDTLIDRRFGVRL